MHSLMPNHGAPALRQSARKRTNHVPPPQSRHPPTGAMGHGAAPAVERRHTPLPATWSATLNAEGWRLRWAQVKPGSAETSRHGDRWLRKPAAPSRHSQQCWSGAARHDLLPAKAPTLSSAARRPCGGQPSMPSLDSRCSTVCHGASWRMATSRRWDMLCPLLRALTKGGRAVVR